MVSSALQVVAETLGRHLDTGPSDSAADASLVPSWGPAVAPSPMQLVLPATAWSWPTDTNGTSSAALYDFCSWMPATASPEDPFTWSAIRFSDGYRSFLEALVGDAATARARQAFSDPRYATTVLYAQSPPQSGLPAWEVSQFPQEWVAGLGPVSQTRATIRIPLPSTGEGSGPGSTVLGTVGAGGGPVDHPLGAASGQVLEISADAWGLITIRPAGWYDSALVRLKRRGPYAAGGRRVFFGPQGSLRNLITGMTVALNPTVSASISADTADAVRDGLTAGASLRVVGLQFEADAVDLPPAGHGPLARLATTAPALESTPTTPMIVGVTVAPLGGGGWPRAAPG